MKIRVHIERLTLDGISLSPREAALFQDSLREELSRTLADRPLRASSSRIAYASAPPIAVKRTSAGKSLGVSVANSVEKGLRS